MAKKKRKRKIFALSVKKDSTREIIERERDNAICDSAEYRTFKDGLDREVSRAKTIASEDPLYLKQVYTLIDTASLAEKARTMEIYNRRVTERQNNDMAYRAKLRELRNRYSAIATELELRYEKLNRFNTVIVSRKSEEYVTVIPDDSDK